MTRHRRPPLSVADILGAYSGPERTSLWLPEDNLGLGRWFAWTYPATGAGGVVPAAGAKTIPRGGTVLLSSSGALPAASSQAGVLAPYGPQGSLSSLGLPWVARGQAIALEWGGLVTPLLTLTGTCQVSVDWHPGPPREWWVDLVTSPAGTALPPFAVDLVWQPDAPGRQLEQPGSSASPVTLAETPGQLVTLAPDATSIRVDVGSATVKVRCRR